jgi:hypothetical protein
MNKIKNFLIIAAITSLLVMSASLVSNQSYGFNDGSDNLPQSNSSSTLFSPPSPVTLETNSPDNRDVTVTIPDEGVCSGGSIKVAVIATGLPAFLCVSVQGTPITSAEVQMGASGQSCPTGFSPSTILIGRETLDLCVKVFV